MEFKPEGGEVITELWDSKLILLLASIGYVVGLGNVWCFCTGGGVVAEGEIEGGQWSGLQGGQNFGGQSEYFN
jgi:hypothetical protein